MKILIADDDAISRLLMSKILGRRGECVLAEDGRQAVEKYTTALEDNAPYDLVCLDVSMPNMDGQQALATIRLIETQRGIARDRSVKIVMATVHEDADNLRRAAKSRCDGYLVKPVTPQDVDNVLLDLGLMR